MFNEDYAEYLNRNQVGTWDLFFLELQRWFCIWEWESMAKRRLLFPFWLLTFPGFSLGFIILALISGLISIFKR